MKRLIIIVLLIIGIQQALISDTSDEEGRDRTAGKRERLLHDIFGQEGLNYSEVKLSVNKTTTEKPQPVINRVLNSVGDTLGYFLVDRAMGRFEYFDFIVVLDRNVNVLKVEVLVYRSQYGSEVCNKRWLSGFEGNICDIQDSFTTRVDAISGATYSSNNMVRRMDEISGILCGSLKGSGF